MSGRGIFASANVNKCNSGVCSGAECNAIMADSLSSNASTASTADHEDRTKVQVEDGRGVENKAFVKEQEDDSESRQVSIQFQM